MKTIQAQNSDVEFVLTVEELHRLHAIEEAAKNLVKAKAEEREACAKVLDEMAEDMEREMEPSTAIAYVRSKAATIRAIGKTK